MRPLFLFSLYHSVFLALSLFLSLSLSFSLSFFLLFLSCCFFLLFLRIPSSPSITINRSLSYSFFLDLFLSFMFLSWPFSSLCLTFCHLSLSLFLFKLKSLNWSNISCCTQIKKKSFVKMYYQMVSFFAVLDSIFLSVSFFLFFNPPISLSLSFHVFLSFFTSFTFFLSILCNLGCFLVSFFLFLKLPFSLSFSLFLSF